MYQTDRLPRKQLSDVWSIIAGDAEGSAVQSPSPSTGAFNITTIALTTLTSWPNPPPSVNYEAYSVHFRLYNNIPTHATTHHPSRAHTHTHTPVRMHS